MRRDAIRGFDKQDREGRILRRVCGSRTNIDGVLTFQNPRLMPSVGTRRSTRVFVPKSVVNIGGSKAEVKVLRSGKRLLPESGLNVAGNYGGGGVELDENGEDWFKLIANSGDERDKVGDGGKMVRAAGRSSAGKGWTGRKQSDLPSWRRSFGSRESRSNRDLTPVDSGNVDSGPRDQGLPGKTSGSVGKPMGLDNQVENPVRISAGEDRLYGITYSRKRRRIPPSLSESKAAYDRMYGIPFVRKQRRKGSETAPEISRGAQILQRISSLDGAVDNNQRVLASSNSDFSPRVVNQVTLVILVESSRSSSYYFLIFLVSILSQMRCSRVRMFNLAAFLFLESIARVFSQQGIHFLPLKPEKLDKNRTTCLSHGFHNLKERVANAAFAEFALSTQHCHGAGAWCSKSNLLPSGAFSQDSSSIDAAQHLCGPGISVIFGASRLVPLVTLNFASLPSYFMCLHSKMFFSSQYFHLNEHGNIGLEEESYSRHSPSVVLTNERSDLARLCKEYSAPTEKGLSVKENANYGYPAPKRRKKGLALDSPRIASLITNKKREIRRTSKAWRPPKKRSPRASTRIPGPSRRDVVGAVASDVGWFPSVSQATQKGHSVDRFSSISYSENNGLTETSLSKVNGVESGKENLDSFLGKFSISGTRDRRILKKLNSSCKVSNTRDKLLGTRINEFADIGADGTGASLDPNHKCRKSTRKSSSKRIKEMKMALAELKQNRDSVCCKANILVIGSDRCWRERGAEVMLESSDSNDCWLAVKTRGATRYLYKAAQEMKPSASNRYTHAMMWTGENGWKLEFCDRKDWIVFKELYRECCDQNLQAAPAKVIPVPGVSEVCDYERSDSVPFMRPSMYIVMGEDEVGRTLMNESANYDMDSGDEEWLIKLNSSPRDSGNDGVDYISEENFEKIIYTFEKAAYCHPDAVFDEDRANSLCMGLGGKNLIVAIYEYWLRKRKQKRKALVRVFQGPPPKRAQLIDKPFLRKKRSFKRQAVQIKKGKPEGFLEVSAAQEAVHRVEVAKTAAGTALECAMVKRRKAQLLMQNADLTTYKSVMALSIAEAVSGTEAFDAVTLIFD